MDVLPLTPLSYTPRPFLVLPRFLRCEVVDPSPGGACKRCVARGREDYCVFPEPKRAKTAPQQKTPEHAPPRPFHGKFAAASSRGSAVGASSYSKSYSKSYSNGPPVPRPRFLGNAAAGSTSTHARGGSAAAAAEAAAHQQRYPFAAEESGRDQLEQEGELDVGMSDAMFGALLRWDCALQGHRYEEGSRRCMECKKLVMKQVQAGE